MPKKTAQQKSSKNRAKSSQRPQTAGRAARKIAPTIAKAKMGDNLASHVAQYIRSLREDTLPPSIRLPSFGYSSGYTRRRTFFRSQLTAGAAVEASCLVNPYIAAFTDHQYREVYTAGTPAVLGSNYVPGVLINSSTTPSGSLPTDSSFTALSPTGGVLPTTGAVGYNAYVRVRGVHIRVLYTGTELNMGGEIIAFHNSGEFPLAINKAAAADGSASWTQPFTTNAEIQASAELASVHRLGRSFEFVWRPRSVDFKNVQSFVGTAENNGTVAQSNTYVAPSGYLPNTIVPGAAPKGWLTGFKILPASGTAATSLNYMVEVMVDADVSVYSSRSSGEALGGTYLPSTEIPQSHPLLESAITNALSSLHATRSAKSIPHNQSNLAIRSRANTASSLVQAEAFASNLAKGALTQLGADALNSAFHSLVA